MIRVDFTLILQWLNFVVLLLVLTRLLYKPLLDMLDSRRAEIENSLKEAHEAEEEAKRKLEEYTQKLNNVKKEALEILEEARAKAEVERKSILERTRRDAERMMEKTREEIARQVEAAKTELMQFVAGLSIDIAEKILEREIRQEDYEALINDYLAQLEGVK